MINFKRLFNGFCIGLIVSSHNVIAFDTPGEPQEAHRAVVLESKSLQFSDCSIELSEIPAGKSFIMVLSGDNEKLQALRKAKSVSLSLIEEQVHIVERVLIHDPYVAIYAVESGAIMLNSKFEFPESESLWRSFYTRLNTLLVENWERRYE